jgi:signal peptidase II
MWYLSILLTVVGLDQLTKFLVVHSFQLYESRQIIPGFLNFIYAMNTGVAFSMFAYYVSPWRHYLFVGINILAILGFTVAHFRMKRGGNGYTLPFALIAGGAAGNVIDRLHYGSVVDFIDIHIGIHHWPTFNIADSAICVGVILFLLMNIYEEKKKSQLNNRSDT